MILYISEKKVIKEQSYELSINKVDQPHPGSVRQQKDFLLGVKNQISL